MHADGAFTDQLPDEIANWRRDGLLSPAQARAIMARYGLAWDESDEPRRQGRLAAVVSTLGAVLAGIGILLFVASNWDQIGRAAKLAILLLTLLLTYGAGEWLARRDHPRLSAALVFLGSLIFGANVFLVAQTYHVSAGSPWLLGAWAAGALGTAYAARSRPSAYLGVLALVLWYGFQIIDWDTFSRGAEAGALSTAGFLQVGLGLFCLGIGHRVIGRLRPFAGAYLNLGITTLFIGLLIFSFAEVWRSLGASSQPTPRFWPMTTLFTALAAAGLLLIALTSARDARSRPTMVRAAGLLLIWLASLLVVLHPLDRPEHYAWIFNLLLLATAIWAVALGIWMRQEPLINLALIFFAIQVLARYFDFFFSLFDRSLVFIGAGVLLLAGGWLIERSRRTLIARMQTEHHGHT